jgi:hypothetical protein
VYPHRTKNPTSPHPRDEQPGIELELPHEGLEEDDFMIEMDEEEQELREAEQEEEEYQEYHAFQEQQIAYEELRHQHPELYKGQEEPGEDKNF